MAPRLIGVWGLMVLTPMTLICYITINQSENYAQADHTLAILSLTLPKKKKKKPFLKSTGESGPFEPIWPLVWPCNKCSMFCSSAGEEPTCSVGDPGSIPGSGRSPGEGIVYPLQYSWASLLAQLVKHQPAMWETWVQPLSWEDPLEKWTATLSSILGQRILWTV